MAQTLEEFLVSVRYNIDAPSQQTFFNAMKKAATSVAGVAGEMTALSLAVMKITETMATAGEKLYWMSQRVGDSVTDIQNAAFALSNLGISASEATSGIERFGAWTRNMGPAATGYLRSLGITARDTVGQMRQLGDYFRAHGGTADKAGTIEYSIALRQAGLMGLDERAMLALSNPNRAEMERQGGIIQRLVWGKDWQTGPDRFAKQSVLVMNQFRMMGFLFTNLSQQASLSLFKLMGPELETVNQLLQGLLPKIQDFLNHVISYAPAAMHFLDGMIKVFGFFIETATKGMDLFDKFPDHLKAMIEILISMPAALKLIGSPIFWLLAGLTSLIFLLDDYQHHLYDLKHPGEKPGAYLPWGKIEDIAKPFLGMGKAADDFIEKWTGVKNGIEWVIGVGLVGMVGGFAPVIAAAMTLAGVFWGAGGIIAGIAIAAAGIKLAGMEEEQLRNEAKAAGYTAIHDPSGGPDMFRDPYGRILESDVVAKRLGHPKGYVTPFELDFAHLKEQYTVPQYPPEPPDLSGDNSLRNKEPWRLFSSPQRGGASRPGIGSEYQRISYSGGGFGGGDDYFSPERFYTLFLFSFTTVVERLTDILATLTDMAEGQGAPRTARGGEGGATMGGPPMTGPEQVAMRDDLMKRLHIPAESAAGIVNNIMGESGGQPGAVSSSGAKGIVQWIGSRWRPLAAWAQGQGLDPNTREGQMAMLQHDLETNFPSLLAELRRGGSGSAMARKFFETFEAGGAEFLMTPSNYATHTGGADNLSHLPLGADGSQSGRPAPDYTNRPSSRPNVNLQTTVNVVAPSPGSAAVQVADAQNRTFEHHIRHAKGSLLA